jgi:hypothetical protein
MTSTSLCHLEFQARSAYGVSKTAILCGFFGGTQITRSAPHTSKTPKALKTVLIFRHECVIPRAPGIRSHPAGQGRSRDDGSLSFKSLACEFQCAAVLYHCTDDLIGCATRNVCIDLQGDLDGRGQQSTQMGYDLVGDSAGVAAYAGRIERDAPMEAPGSVFQWFSRTQRWFQGWTIGLPENRSILTRRQHPPPLTQSR